jgi:ribosome-binding protein aMBF1 (putative translation factor)
MAPEENTLLELSSIGDSGDLGRSFSARLRELRRAKALSLRKLGREVGVTANAVLRWEKDEVTPTRGKMIELSRFFDGRTCVARVGHRLETQSPEAC